MVYLYPARVNHWLLEYNRSAKTDAHPFKQLNLTLGPFINYNTMGYVLKTSFL